MINKNKIIDSWLVIRARDGDNKALTLLVKRWNKKLCRHANWYTKDIDYAKDVVQDCWPIIIKKLNSLRDASSFGSWALSIVTRKSLDVLRKNKRELRRKEAYIHHNASTINDTTIHTNENLKVTLKMGIELLPQQSKIVLHLYYMEDLSIKQISEILDVPKGTVKSRLFNAREKLKVIFKQHNYEK